MCIRHVNDVGQSPSVPRNRAWQRNDDIYREIISSFQLDSSGCDVDCSVHWDMVRNLEHA